MLFATRSERSGKRRREEEEKKKEKGRRKEIEEDSLATPTTLKHESYTTS